MKKLFSIKNILIGIGLIIFDLTIYIFLGLVLLNYEDFYDESKGAYFSLESMTFWQKISYICLNLWYLINIIFICFLIYKVSIKVFSLKNFKR